MFRERVNERSSVAWRPSVLVEQVRCYTVGVESLSWGRQFETALQIRPDARAYTGLGSALRRKGRLNEAIASYEKALEMAPRSQLICQNLALLLATCPDPSLRNGPKAVELAERADQLSGGGDPGILHALAAAYAQTGQFSKAVATAQRALGLATDQGKTGLAGLLREEIDGYQAAAFYRETTK
jgi:tetratricopeptide (TPR) repeat protein